MKKFILLLALLFLNVSIAQDLNTFFSKANTFLNEYVKDGKVDYQSISDNQSNLDELLTIAKSISVETSDTKNYQAFWINAYNLAVIKGIIDNYPIQSPLDKQGFFDKIKYRLGGKDLTLNDIEHNLLRANFKDPRFHFVLVCGAIGCPPLISEAYTPDKLNAQLDRQTKEAINGNFLRINHKKKRVEGSEILKWYKEDFILEGNEIDFINKYLTNKIPTNYKLSYFSYNWNLNKL